MPKRKSKKSVSEQELGNHFFAEGNFAKAIEQYSRALENIDFSNNDSANMEVAQLYANRSACFLQMSSHKKHVIDKALEDAELSIKAAPAWCKGFYCLGIGHPNFAWGYD